MPVRVLVVDDSVFFRHRISDILNKDPRLEVVGTAADGKEAVKQAKALQPDVITMDVEMPKLNGIDAVQRIMRECPTRVLMVSSLTQEGAQVTLRALEAGAIDYLSKDMRAWLDKSPSLDHDLIGRIVAISRAPKPQSHWLDSASRRTQSSSTASTQSSRFFDSSRPLPGESSRASTRISSAGRTTTAPTRPVTPRPVDKSASSLHTSAAAVRAQMPKMCKMVVIGSSTGGPAALQEILTQLPSNFRLPILLVQHMPKTFTSVFAERLNQQCQIEVKEAETGDMIRPGRALLAPGGSQMIIDAGNRVSVLPSDSRLTYQPSVDITYTSVAKHYRDRALAVILTGMGSDGTDGAKVLREAGAVVWAQSEATCTIYGMPRAVVKAGAASSVLDLTDIAKALCQLGR